MSVYEFDAPYTDVPIDALPSAEQRRIVYHRLNKPTLKLLLEREDRVVYKLTDVSSRAQEIESSEEVANARFWEAIISQVKGYRDAPDWRDLSDEEKASMRPGHKSAAVRALYAGSAEIEGGEDGISIGADTWTVVQKIGLTTETPDFTIRHFLREPTEAERVKYKQSATKTLNIKGARRSQVTVQTKIKPHGELYDALIEGVEGGTVGGAVFQGSSRKDFLAAIDPLWKRVIIQCLMSALEAQISD